MEIPTGDVVNEEAVMNTKLKLFLMKAKIYWINLVNTPIHQILIRCKQILYIRV